LAGAIAVSAFLVVATLLATNSSSGASSRPLALVNNRLAVETAAATVEPTAVAPDPPTTVAAEPAPAPPPLAVVQVATVVREPEPVPEPEPLQAQPPATSAAERCAAARQWGEAHGLALPKGFAFRCPDPAVFADGASRWGTTCWNCGIGAGSYVAINIDRIGSSDDALRYVIAHETCHAIENVVTSTTSEASADACAAAHGAPRP
jgi:hypothetical protein